MALEKPFAGIIQADADYPEQFVPKEFLPPSEHPSYPILRRLRTLLRETMKEARPTQVPAIAEALRIANDYLERSER